MIQKSTAYKTSDGQTVATLKEAQQIELLLLIGSPDGPESTVLSDRAIVSKLVEQAAKVVDILTTKENSRPKARKVNGAARKPKAKTTATTV